MIKIIIVLNEFKADADFISYITENDSEIFKSDIMGLLVNEGLIPEEAFEAIRIEMDYDS